MRRTEKKQLISKKREKQGKKPCRKRRNREKTAKNKKRRIFPGKALYTKGKTAKIWKIRKNRKKELKSLAG